jgi:hypothetical protein
VAKSTEVNLGLNHSQTSSTRRPCSRGNTLIRLTRTYLLNFRALTFALCFVFLAFGAQAQTVNFSENWTTVGSDGTVDESAAGKVFFELSKVQKGRIVVAPGGSAKRALIGPQTDSAVIRYNVTPVASFFVPLECQPGASGHIQLKVRYLAVGPGARVVAKLIEVDVSGGTERSLLTFDSRSFGLSNKYQVQTAGVCGRPWTFDFERKVYYIEATLTNNSILVGSAAGIQAITIDNFVSP